LLARNRFSRSLVHLPSYAPALLEERVDNHQTTQQQLQQKMGFNVTQVVSDHKHYSSFICKVCQNLASLDALVTACNHVFCAPCLEVWIQKREVEELNCRCPSCNEDLEASQHKEGTTTLFGDIPIRARPLEVAQPLAYQVLRLVQVACIEVDPTTGAECEWTGDYSEWKKHKVEHQLMAGSNTTGQELRKMSSGRNLNDRPSQHQKAKSMRDLGSSSSELVGGVEAAGGNGVDDRREDLQRRKSQSDLDAISLAGSLKLGEPTAAHHQRSTKPQQPPQGGGSDEVDPAELLRATERCDKLKKQANAKFNRGDVEGARQLYSEGLALVSTFSERNEEVKILKASLYSNRAVTYFRERILPPSIEDCNRSLELDPKSEKTYIRKWRALSANGQNEEATECLQQGLRLLPTSSKLAEELRKSMVLPPTPNHNNNNMRNSDYMMDMNYSIASMSMVGAETIVSRAHYQGDPTPYNLERAEKLKKQANAKFNKGDIDAARGLYTDALACIPTKGEQSDEIRALLAMLYSNRAVTFFRDKMYRESLADCEKAIELDPDSEKSYIRKSRALAGLELHRDAHRCLEEASRILPHSKKLKEELEKSFQENQMDEEIPLKGGESGDFEGNNSTDSGDFNNSVGSFNLYINPNNDRGTKDSPSGNKDNDYAEELELADKLKRNANAKFNRGDIAGARLLYTEALACLPNDRNHEEVRACLASLYANRAVTFFREKEYGPSTWDCDKSIELDPKGEKSYIRKARALVSLNRFSDAITCLEGGLKEVPRSRRLEEELAKARDQMAGDIKSTNGGKVNLAEQNEKDFMVSVSDFDYNPTSVASQGTNFDPHSSIASMNIFGTPARERNVLGSVAEDKRAEFHIPYNEELERAEKLKKQANAKLNKGDVPGARVLYGEGLACLPSDGPRSDAARELAASLYANRAVTFFREKKFSATVVDCDKSLELDPKHEKSYIRKWRALMALGNSEEAYMCLEAATRELPNSKRLNEELASASEQKELLTTINQLIAQGEYQEARDTLKPLVKNSDNVSLWLAAARADACLGLTESALERVNKVLMFNSKHSEGLQVRGYAMFLSGEMEHGIALLKESLEVDIDNINSEASEQLDQCQKAFNSFNKGQGRVKRGRYKEAVELFTSSMEAGIAIPKEAPLYGLLLTERAEASLLSQQYQEALDDCNDAIRYKNDNMAAWTVKVEVYFALGRLQEARDDLAEARKTWGAGNETIEESYKKTDFELRLKKADDELHKLVAAVESGKPDFVDEGGGGGRTAERRGSIKSVPSRARASVAPKTTPTDKSGSQRKNRKTSSSASQGAKGPTRTHSTSRRKNRRSHQGASNGRPSNESIVT
jgi:tetratricopeptide (TPR) repeat protein